MSGSERTTCKACSRKLPEGKTRFCSLVCRERYSRWKSPHHQAQAYFWKQVVTVVWITDLATKLGVSREEAATRAESLLRTGEFVGLRRNGTLAAIGKRHHGDPTTKPSLALRGKARKEAERRLRERARIRRRAKRRTKAQAAS